MQEPGCIHCVKLQKNVRKNLSFRIFDVFQKKELKNMTHPIYKLKEHISYKIKARHRYGHGIHSPYLYHFVTSILQDRHPYYCFERIESSRRESSKGLILKTVDSFLRRRRSKEEARCGQIIFRIIQHEKIKTMLEIGTLTGMETQYMTLAKPKARCITVTSETETAANTQKLFQKLGLNQIEMHLLKSEANLTTILKECDTLDFVLFNLLSDPLQIPDLFNLCLSKKQKGSIFVFRNIHGSPEFTKIWQSLRQNVQVQVSIDIYDLGILMFNPEYGKKKYVLSKK